MLSFGDELKKIAMEKAAAAPLLAGVGLARGWEKAKKERHKGRVAVENMKRLQVGAPLLPMDH